MVGFVYGRSGSGKSDWIFSRMEEAAARGHVYLLVPDREAVAAESRAAELSGAGNVDVITFGRLCNYVFRKYGGLCADYIGSGAKKLVMRNVLRALSPALKEYGEASGFGMIEKLTAARSTLYQDKISPAELDRASGFFDEHSPIRTKTSDLAVIFAAFDAEIAAKWEDPDGILSKAAALLRGGGFFAGSTVFIDSFTSFSAQQYDILEPMMTGADDVYITLSYLPDDADGASSGILSDTDRRLRRTAQRAGTPVRGIFLRSAKRYRSAELAFLSENIAGTGRARAVWQDEPAHIRLVRAANAFAESEAAALDICRLIRGGVRYREISVIVRDTAQAEGVVDAVFRKYGIPCFLSSRKEISEKPLVKLIFSVFAILERGFRGEDVVAYVKTGLAGVTPDEVSLFENYIQKWNIRGRMFTGDDPWNMNPHGYGTSLSASDEEELAMLADIRGRVISPLKAFAAAQRTLHTVRERAALLFDFLSGLGVPETLSARAEAETERGDTAAASETVQLWNVFCGALDQLVVTSGETEAQTAEFSQMLSVILSETDIGRIPTSVDEVTVSSASETVPGRPKYVYLLNANEGVFPQRVGEDGLFSEYEKAQLREQGVELTDRTERRVSEELFYFYRAAALPSERLYISYSHYGLSGSEQRESGGVKRICALFPALAAVDFELSKKSDLIESRSASFEHALSFPGNLGRALREYYEADPVYAEKLKYAKTPLSAANCRLSPESADALFGGRLSTSYTRLEKYIKCNFSYFCEYELRLRDNLPASFGAVDIGSFMHGILEKTVEWIAANDGGELSEEIRKIAEAYIMSVFHKEPSALPERFRHLFGYLCRSAELFAGRLKAEFEASAFRPCDFELTVGQGGESVLPMKLAGDGISVELRGKIDRVDAYEDGEGRLYLRVVDYKTGEKTFDIRNVRLGLDMQMLLYLFSLWENGAQRYGREILPAGVLYSGVKPPQVDLTIGGDVGEDDVKIRTSGLFLKNEEILRAMEPALAGAFIPVKAGDLAKEKSSLIGLDAFMELKREVTQTVLRYAGELRRGAACARPLITNGKSPCEYCKMRPVCRISSK